ncbi:MAG: PH domain-containing protein [Oscillospiraceae bacterium]|nr:PH domain-containing protein [Oscillospiraceae bacterium]
MDKKETNALSVEEQLRGDGIRNHFSKAIVDSLKVGLTLLFVILVNSSEIIGELASEDVSKEGIIAALILIGVLLVIAAIVFILSFLRWRKTYIKIDGENLVVNNNYLIRKKVTSVRLSSISTVNFQQGIPEKIFGTYKLQADIDSSVTADSTDFNLVFDKETAFKIKEILTRKGAPIENQKEDEKPEENKRLIYEFTVSQTIRHFLLCISIMVVIITALTAIGGIVLLFDENNGNVFGTVLGIVFIVVPLIWTQIKPLISYYDFKIEKLDDSAIISYGLITKKQYSLPLSKTNAIVVHQPLFARLFGYYYAEFINVGMGDVEKNETPICCLCVKYNEMQEIIRELKPELQVSGYGEASPKKAFIPAMIPAVLWSLFFIIAMVVLAVLDVPFWWLGFILIFLSLLSGLLAYKTKALAVLQDKVVVTYGIFHKKSLIVPNAKIQNIDVKINPISRHFGVAHANLTILGSKLLNVHPIGYFENARFDALFENTVKSSPFYVGH